MSVESHWVEGNPVGMIPRSAQASLLRKSLFTWSVMYIICRVDLFPCGSASLTRMAPRMVIWLSLAARILRQTGRSSLGVSPSFLMVAVPARQLWQPVSAMACVVNLRWGTFSR